MMRDDACECAYQVDIHEARDEGARRLSCNPERGNMNTLWTYVAVR